MSEQTSDNPTTETLQTNPPVISFAFEDSKFGQDWIDALTDDEGDDIHCCKKCKLVFTNITNYLEHKIGHDNFKVRYARSTRDRRMVLPHLVEKVTYKGAADDNMEAETSEKKLHEKKEKLKKGPRKKPLEEIDQEVLSERRKQYQCSKCAKNFNREAALKRHEEYDHNAQEEIDDLDVDIKTEPLDPQDENDTDYMQPPPELRRVKLHQEKVLGRTHVCDICGSAFKEINVLKTHLLTHTNKRDFACPHPGCTYAFKIKGSLERHLRRHTGERPFFCQLCGRSFRESGALTRHRKSRTPCTAKSDSDLPRYGKTWRFDPQIPAALANVKDGEVPGTGEIPNPEEQTTSNEVDDGLTEMIPGAGDDSFTALDTSIGQTDIGAEEETPVTESLPAPVTNGLRTSCVSVLDTVKFSSSQCGVCSEEFETIDQLKMHLRTHLMDMPFRCGLCEFVCSKRERLNQHMLMEHQTELKVQPSDVLVVPVKTTTPVSSENTQDPMNDEAAKTAQVAMKQLIELPSAVSEGTITELKPRASHKCPICERVFRGNTYLKMHMKSHTGNRPHKCPLCEKAFITKDTLNKHISTHSENRNFKCGDCGKMFKRLTHVQEHVKIHSEVRPYSCSICGRTFKTSNAMKVHIRTHTDILPFECDVCKRRFRERGSLLRHTRMHTGEKPFKCHHCGRCFSEHGTLSRHMKAKVPCTKELYAARQQQRNEESNVPTVLAEFSSVVTDTQQYIMADEGEQAAQNVQNVEQPADFVVLHTDLPEEALKHVEIVAETDIDPSMLESVPTENSSYILVNDNGNDLKVIDSRTGATVAVMPASSFASDSDIQNIQSITLTGDNQIEAIAMAPTAEIEESFHHAMNIANIGRPEDGHSTEELLADVISS